MHSAEKILVLAPHTDDGEIGAGGLINKLISEGSEVYYVAFSICEESVPEGYPKDVLATEVMDATYELGIKPDNVFIYRKKVRLFTEQRQEILDEMIKLRSKISPDLVILPSKYDCHQDHKVVYEEGVRAFRYSTLLGYEMPWNNISFDSNLFVELEEAHVDAKVRSFAKYKSQMSRRYEPKDLKALAQTRGLQVNTRYAEVYNVIRWLWK
ncbi:MAG: PIG-L family deacetylase [Gammaproteobacteria bacterium]|nr:PIG-L family deacetylase [Gammaproteobacteria bacterium]